MDPVEHTENSSIDTISVVGFSYLQPIADLLDKLLSIPSLSACGQKPGANEVGYSAAVIVLFVALLESFVTRVQFFRPVSNKKLGMLKKFEELFPSWTGQQELAEVLLIRNSLAHNHVWNIESSYGEYANEKIIGTPLSLGINDTHNNYPSLVDEGCGVTKKLRLNVIPTSVCCADVAIVFSVVWKTLVFMNKASWAETPISGQTVKFRGRPTKFEDLLTFFTKETPVSSPK